MKISELEPKLWYLYYNYSFLVLFRTNVLLNNRALSVPSGFPLGPVRLNGSLWIGGVDNPTIIPRVFPVINVFEGDMKELKLNRE